MIRIPEVTLFAIDCVTPQHTIAAMEYSTRFVKFAECVLLTDTKKHVIENPHFGPHQQYIRIVHHEESDRKVPCPRKDHYPLPIDYEMASLREPSQHVHTSHLLFIENDAAVLNPWAWYPGWLDYDFIGAPWPPHTEEGWPPCDGETNAVGNFGFSLRSKRFCELTREAVDSPEFANDPAKISCDMWACRVIRPWLEKRGVKFAPPEVAAAFSCENRIYAGSFGFHGPWTVLRNGWSGPFFDRLKEKVGKYK